ncbi:MAG: hypothetical protein ACRDPI_01735, partial [Nocardioidaceae bacterium]
LHYYFPWAISALVKWSAYCLVSGRKTRVDLQTGRYFEIADDESLSYDEKLTGYLALADEHFETARYHAWCEAHLAGFDERVRDWFTGREFDAILVDTVSSTYPEHERERFLAHFRGLLALWVSDQAPSVPVTD